MRKRGVLRQPINYRRTSSARAAPTSPTIPTRSASSETPAHRDPSRRCASRTIRTRRPEPARERERAREQEPEPRFVRSPLAPWSPVQVARARSWSHEAQVRARMVHALCPEAVGRVRHPREASVPSPACGMYSSFVILTSMTYCAHVSRKPADSGHQPLALGP